jgi:hypothetical protein
MVKGRNLLVAAMALILTAGCRASGEVVPAPFDGSVLSDSKESGSKEPKSNELESGIDILTLNYPQDLTLNITGTAAIYTSLEEIIGFVAAVNGNRGGEQPAPHTRETMAKEVKYIAEKAIVELLRLNDGKGGNISHPELEADGRLARFFASGEIISVPVIDVLAFSTVEERLTVVAYVEFDNGGGTDPIALDFHISEDYPLIKVRPLQEIIFYPPSTARL